ncbi:DEAD/DEAH box helicase [Clostridium algidicarnis]|uniref:DEAD/DEAH box helicase n=1 Tax=Clostridium algidicarnis TaxID=37659 RepID=UPI001C0E4D05|nr:DEAD/DEAH box helicase [Clostridium algidicarnis]MBU3204686.1 DEAD/DEAH box helicase [Clostridium algidicarnis]MBU3212829.1 DEAD/DEAH box helicase [Clostridium algidicarnis]MBU3223473.1 DEAD/DEAH box helicase [Clostridium algidicarnis]MCB2286237.1 DEAD/DEAH box helicase [Clostridium algidicarnis]
MLFENLNIITPIKKALKLEGYEKPTPIQEQSIPPILNGRDFLGCAQTGTGKTAAFAIPILQLMINKENPKSKSNHIKALILAPTRELAIQIGESFESYGKYIDLKTLVIFGGVSQNPQTNALKSGVDILVATPGRLIDLVNQKFIDLHRVEFFVLDEADCMLDMGMIHDVKKIITRLPVTRQNMLFSATMPNEIKKLVDSILKDPVKVAVAPVSSTIDTVDQSVYFVSKKNKRSLLIHLLEDKSIVSALVFSRTKHGANKITEDLVKAGINAQAIHGNKSQSARQLALSNFKEGKTRVLVATDIAARGIDIDHLSHVINFDLTNVPETHVHRIGRTGRAGLNGIAISFCDEEEFAYLKDIEHLIEKSIPVVKDHPYAINITTPIINNDIKKKTSNNRPSTKRSNSNNSFRKNTRKPRPKK